MPDLSSDDTGNGTRAVRVRVSGDVQGVFFRANTRELAQGHGITGWVRNDPGGTVTAVLEGPAEGVESVVGWIRDGGPPRATVDEVDVEPIEPEGHGAFTVRR